MTKVKEDGRTGNQRVGRLRKKVVEKENENEDYKKEAESVKTSRGKRQRTTKKVAHEDSEDGENEIAEVVKKDR
ncbi:hypothetical protein NQ314_008915 [Rhamnusium bicolor]|uniref:Uncharacterized protein n=1 Tax=Rhamnusium bicolor TaxID=1586634 RepID=A0AAV8Y6I3_9CUCU|nr:hypothetical protein NQ314_008915 [Rhamnusium bicolor]